MDQDGDMFIQWFDIETVPRAHLIMYEGSDWVTSICGKRYRSKDLIQPPHENRQCKTCARRERKMFK